MTTKYKIEVISNYLDELLPHASCELTYQKDYELVIAVMLSAQTTDAAVNKVTNLLFRDKPTLESIANSSILEIEKYCHSIGLYKNKARHMIGIAQKLLSDFNGVVPSDKKLLTTFPGVGNKTAAVIRAEIFKIPDFAVDTHVLRVSKRLNLVPDNYGPDETEKRLKKLFKKERWIKTHHQFIHFGRYHCLARNPHCKSCKLRDFCSKI